MKKAYRKTIHLISIYVVWNLLIISSQIESFLRIHPETTLCSAQESSIPYTSITALDKYGSIPQIRNARLASDQHGMLTLVAIAKSERNDRHSPQVRIGKDLLDHDKQTEEEEEEEDENHGNDEVIVVVSLEKQKLGIIPSSTLKCSNNSQDTSLLLDNKRDGKIMIVALDDDPIHHIHSTVAIIGSGLKSDLVFLVNLLRRYSCDMWERYDNIPTCRQIAIAVSQVFSSFMGYEGLEDTTWSHAIPHVLFNREESENGAILIGRPLGLRVCTLERIQTGDRKHLVANMRVVDPSGFISDPIMAHAMGKGCIKANKLLFARYKPTMTTLQVEALLLDIVREVVLGPQESMSESFKLDGTGNFFILCETFRREGIRTKRLPLISI